jgi:hypothetical protein
MLEQTDLDGADIGESIQENLNEIEEILKGA